MANGEIVAIVRRPPSPMLLAREEVVRALVVRSWTGLKRQAPNERLQDDPSSRDVTHVPRRGKKQVTARARENFQLNIRHAR